MAEFELVGYTPRHGGTRVRRNRQARRDQALTFALAPAHHVGPDPWVGRHAVVPVRFSREPGRRCKGSAFFALIV